MVQVKVLFGVTGRVMPNARVHGRVAHPCVSV